MRRNALRFLALMAFGFAGCSEAGTRPLSTCEPMVAQICSSAAEAELKHDNLAIGYSSRPDEVRVVPFVVPVFRQDGALATEVNCYASADSHTFSIVRSDLAIPHLSQESIDFLNDRHLCADKGFVAEVENPGLQMVSEQTSSSSLSR